MLVTLPEYRISYALIPFKRDQDVIKIKKGINNTHFSVSVIDGWNNLDETSGNSPGKKVASFVADTFPKLFLSFNDEYNLKAIKTAQAIDKDIITQYPAHVSCVGAFLFSYDNKDVIVTIGSVFVYVWNKDHWEKPDEIGVYSLDPKKYPSDVSRFIGRGELKELNSDLYTCKPDTCIVQPFKPIFIGTDGIEELISIKDLNELSNTIGFDNSEKFISSLTDLALSRKRLQNDDASIFVKF